LGWKSEIARSALKKALPFKPALRRLRRRVLPYPPACADSRIAIEHGIKLIELLRACDFEVDGKVGLEIGTGWIPTIPIIHWLHGARRFYLTDVVRYLDRQTLDLAKRNVQAHRDLIASRLGEPQRRLPQAQSESAALGHFGFEYFAPIKWHQTPPESVDYVISRAVLEHISAQQIPGLLSSVSSVLKPGGLIASIIDNSDHFQHEDHTISRLNFLKFSDRTWSLICWLTDHQNRLRHSDYQRMLSSSDLRIVHEESYTDPEALIAAGKLPMHPRFRTYDLEDLAILTSCFVLRKPAR
jgi:SAM-dependent methyltransferase